MTSLAEALGRTKAWLAEHAPASLENLNAPADRRDVAKLKFLLPAETPQEFYELLKMHDGEGWQRLESLFPHFNLMPATEVVRVYSYVLQQPEESIGFAAAEVASGRRRARGPVFAIRNSPRRVPFATMDGKIYWHVDLVPALGGSQGQVISEDVEDGKWKVLAPSLVALFESYLLALESEQIDVDSEGNVRNERGLWPSTNATR